MAEISFVLPNWNNENYLLQCITSVTDNDPMDYELIVIDDESTDGSLEIAREAAASNSRIRLFEKSHSGLGASRNHGIEQATGDYIAFIDGDDWVDIESYLEILESAKRDKADIVFFGYVREDLDIGVSRTVSLETTEEVDPDLLNAQLISEMVGPSFLPSPFTKQEMLGAAWRRLYKRTFILESGILFPDEPLLEDSPFALRSHMIAQNVSFSTAAPYHYRMNPESMTWKRRSGLFNQYERLFKLVEDILDEVAIVSGNSTEGQRYISHDSLQRRHKAWFVRFAAHSALIDRMFSNESISQRNRIDAVREILDDPLVRQCVEESDLRFGSVSDRIILLLIKQRIAPLAAAFYYWYSRRLSSSSNRKR